MNELVVERDGIRLRLHSLSSTPEVIPATRGMPETTLIYLRYDCSVEMGGLSATTVVFDLYPSGAAAFFDSLRSKWRGWEGVLKGSSLESHLAFEATRDSLGHVFLKIILISDMSNPFRVETTMTLDIGDLEGLAKKAARFFTS